jgi:hypothetical protein
MLILTCGINNIACVISKNIVFNASPISVIFAKLQQLRYFKQLFKAELDILEVKPDKVNRSIFIA